MKKSLCFVSLVLASQGFASLLPAPVRNKGFNDEEELVLSSLSTAQGSAAYAEIDLGNGMIAKVKTDAISMMTVLGGASSVRGFLDRSPEMVEAFAQAGLQQMSRSAGLFSANPTQRPVECECRRSITHFNNDTSEGSRFQELPALSGMPPALPLAPFAPTNGHFGAAPPPALSEMTPAKPWAPSLLSAAPPPALSEMTPAKPWPPSIPSAVPAPTAPFAPTNGQLSAAPEPALSGMSFADPFSAFSNSHVNSFVPQNGYGGYENSAGLPEPLPPEVLSPSGNQQFVPSQASTLGTGSQHIAAENPKMTSAPPPPPPPPPTPPGPGNASKLPTVIGTNDVTPSSQSGTKPADALSASGGDNPLPKSPKKSKEKLTFEEELRQRCNEKLAGGAQKAADQKSDNAKNATDAALKKLQQYVGVSKEDKDLRKLHDNLKTVTDVAQWLGFKTFTTDAEALDNEDNLELLKQAASDVNSLDGLTLSENSLAILKTAAEKGELPPSFHKIVEEALMEEERAKDLSSLIGLALQHLEYQEAVSPTPDGASQGESSNVAAGLRRRIAEDSSLPSLAEKLALLKQRQAEDDSEFYDDSVKVEKLRDLLPKTLLLSEMMATVQKTQAELAAKLPVPTTASNNATAQSAAPQGAASTKGEFVKKPLQAPVDLLGSADEQSTVLPPEASQPPSASFAQEKTSGVAEANLIYFD